MQLHILKYILSNKYVLGITVLVISYTSFFAYYMYAKYKIQTLTATANQLQLDVAQKNSYIQNLKTDYDKILKLKDDLTKLNETSATRIADLRSRLNRESQQKKSIGQLAKQKPTLVEKFINKEIKKQIDCFKTITPDGDC